jgi:hypothetical protein
MPPEKKPILNGTSILMAKIITAIAGLGLLGGGGAMMITSDDAKQMVEIEVIKVNQETLLEDLKEHELDIDKLRVGQTTIKANQGEAARVRSRLSNQLQRMEEKIDEIPKGN